jgi:putative hemolysin
MTLSAQLLGLFRPDDITDTRTRLQVGLAANGEEVRAAQRLRYQVFVEEMGARLDCEEPGIEADRYDPHCQHLIVRNLGTGQVVGCYRILTDVAAARVGTYYSHNEFDLARILALPGRIMEVGRTCVHRDYRNGATIALLWQGLARFMAMNRFDCLMGCASIPLRRGTDEAREIYQRLAARHLSPPEWRVYPRNPLPRVNLAVSRETVAGGEESAGARPGREAAPAVPPLIRAYLRAGARICGEPAWDPQFNVADLFILLRTGDIQDRYARHFVNRT